jgi:hypothetical protein
MTRALEVFDERERSTTDDAARGIVSSHRSCDCARESELSFVTSQVFRSRRRYRAGSTATRSQFLTDAIASDKSLRGERYSLRNTSIAQCEEWTPRGVLYIS